jgi:ribosomal-protein-alanine N-acetyltransferase
MLHLNFSPFPILKSSKIILRKITEDDTDNIFELRSNPQTMRFIPRPLATTKQDAVDLITLMNDKIIANTDINWAITLPDNDDLIGIIGHYRIDHENFRSEIGYILNPNFHNKGIVTAAIKLVLQYGFINLQLHSVEARINPNNFASEKVLLKNGFIKEAHLIENEFFEGKFIDTVIYSLLKKSYLS